MKNKKGLEPGTSLSLDWKRCLKKTPSVVYYLGNFDDLIQSDTVLFDTLILCYLCNPFISVSSDPLNLETVKKEKKYKKLNIS